MNKRREIRFKREEEKKSILRLYREYRELNPYKPIDYVEVKPIRDGFTRTFKLREDLIGRPDYKYLTEALKACNTVQFCRNRKFLFPKRKYARFYNSFFKKDELELDYLNEKEYSNLSERAKEFFYYVEKVSWSGVIYKRYYCSIPKWMLLYKIEPHYIRYFAIFDNEVVKRYGELNSKIEKNYLWPKIDKALGASYGSGRYDWYDSSKKRKAERQFKKEIDREIEEAIETFFN